MKDIAKIKIQIDATDRESVAFEVLSNAKLTNSEIKELAALYGIRFTLNENKSTMIWTIIGRTASMRAYGKNIQNSLRNRTT